MDLCISLREDILRRNANEINFVLCILYVPNVPLLRDQTLTVEALYLVTAADEYYSTIGKSLCVMAALPRERP